MTPPVNVTPPVYVPPAVLLVTPNHVRTVALDKYVAATGVVKSVAPSSPPPAAGHCILLGAIPVVVLVAVNKVANPLAVLNITLSNTTRPKLACVTPTELATVPAAFMANLLCAIAAALLTW